MQTFSLVSPPPGLGRCSSTHVSGKGREVSDCTPPTGVRWAARDVCTEVGVKSPSPHTTTTTDFVF